MGEKLSTYTLSTQALNAIFTSVAQAMGAVFWLRTLDYNQQIFVSPNYETIWGRPCQELYENPGSFIDTLPTTDRDEFYLQTLKRKDTLIKVNDESNFAHNTLLFRVEKINGELVHIRDRSFILSDAQGIPRFFAGIGQVISADLWSHEKQTTLPTEKQILSLEQSLWPILLQNLHLAPCRPTPLNIEKSKINEKNNSPNYFIIYDNKSYKLSFRQAQCLYYSAEGLSAKQVAEKLGLSKRTIETYLENLKNKLKCINKMHMLTKIDLRNLENHKTLLIPK